MKTTVIHKNTWVWGETVTIVTPDGKGMVEMSFSNSNKGVCYVSGLSVVPEQRRKGLGTTLMKWCYQYCLEHGIFRIDINSVLEPFVMEMYHKLGFRDVKETDGFMEMYLMVR